jgi:hypothetical protein
MDAIDERFLVYTAVLFVCSAIATFAGFTAAFATFSMVTVGVEFAYWLGGVMSAPGQSGASN